MAENHFANHRGTITGLAASGPSVLYVTRHDEDQPTALCVFDFDKQKASQSALPAGATALALIEKTVYVACTDGAVYTALPGKKPAKFHEASDVSAIHPVKGGVAIASGNALLLIDSKGAKAAEFDLGEPVSALAASPDGSWLTAGTRRGHVAVFNLDDEWTEQQRDRLHDGEITALQFAPDELRVYSTGTDARVLVSFVRGAFDTEDRGGNNSHERPIRDLIVGPEFSTEDGLKRRFYTVSDDSSIKSWPLGRSGSKRPSTLTDGVVQSSKATIVVLDDTPHLAVAGGDATIRLYSFDDEGKATEHVATVHDAYTHAEEQLDASTAKARQKGYEALAAFNDAYGIEILASVADYESDHKLKVKAVQLLAGCTHKDVPAALENFFHADAADVRAVAFDGLVAIRGSDHRQTLEKAIDTGWEDLGLAAVSAAQSSGSAAAKDLLRNALDNDNENVRIAALSALEALFKDNPQGTLIGLESSHESMRRRALVRLYQRKLLDDPRVAARIRRTYDDAEYRVRHTAFHVATLRRPNLVAALRPLDAQYHRQIFELEHFDKPEKDRPKEVPNAKPSKKALVEEDLHPILEAAASRDLEVSLLGARALAVADDERALGTLLQHTRATPPHARANAAIALQALSDPRAINRIRMMLHDSEQSVRDAAFTALEALQNDDPFATVSAGLASPNTDTRGRALALLAKTLKSAKGKPKGDFAGRDLLLRALNDADTSLRLEAFKNALNLEVEGGGPDTLRFILQSHHADVRRQCLEEAQAHPKDDAYKAFLLELFDDANTGIFTDAFNFALDRWPSSEHGKVYERMIAAAGPGARIAGLQKLATERNKDLRPILANALQDQHSAVRLAAVQGLVTADLRDHLTSAMSSEFEDVRVESASALASLGDERALKGLLSIVDDYRKLLVDNAPAHAVESREDRVVSAIGGIRDLGHAEALDPIVALLEVAKSDPIVEAAASSLPWLTRPKTLDTVRPLVRSDFAAVSQQAALALAYHGDPTVDAHIFGKLGAARELVAAFALRDTSRDRFLAYVDGDDPIARQALAIVLLLELSEHDGVPERCVSLLSAQNARVRLRAGQAIEHYAEQPKFYAWVYEAVNELANPAGNYDVPAKTLLALSRALAFGPPLVAVRAAQLVGQMQADDSFGFETGWNVFSRRLADELARLEKMANKPKSERPKEGRLAAAWRTIGAKLADLVTNADTFEEALANLAFGAYIGLARETGGSDPHTVRSAAIGGLLRLVEAHDSYRFDVRNVLLLGLGDPAQNVRTRAFEGLLTLGVDHDTISTEALSTGLSDMGFRGLELLAGSGGGNELLEQTLLESTNGLENEASRLLVDRVGEVAVNIIGVEAASEHFRTRSVYGLAKHYSDKSAADALRAATSSSFEDVRKLAAFQLAERKDPAAFEPLVEISATDDYDDQWSVATAFQALADPRAADVLLDRLEADPELEAADAYLDAVIDLGNADTAARLLDWVDRDIMRSDAANAVKQLSGYTQYEWMDDEDVTAEWEAKLDPLHPDVYADLLDLAYRLSDVGILNEIIGMSKWVAPNPSVDKTLSALLNFKADENIRHRAVEMAGYRFAHRQGPPEGLVELVSSGDPLDQFYASEGLALGGRGEGLAVLRTAADAMSDWSLRERAILAMGKLADPSVLDYLLELADNDMEYLQSSAAEAIGHMSESDRASEIFAILKRIAIGSGGAQTSAFKGLRWFDTPAAWDVLRSQAKADYWWIAEQAVQLLRYDDGSREILAEILRTTDDWDIANSAAEGLRHQYGPDSLEPDYIIVTAEQSGFDASEDTLDRLREQGDVTRILEVLPKIHEDNRSEYYEPLVQALLSKEPLPIAEAAGLVDSDDGRTASVAARILGRAGADASKHKKAVEAAVTSAHEQWQSAYDDFLANRSGARERLDNVSLSYRWLVWACGQLEAAAPAIATAAKLPSHAMSWPIREPAIATLGESWVGKVGIETLTELAKTGDAQVRAMASAELDRAAPEQAAKLLPSAFDDDVRVGRLSHSLTPDQARGPLRAAIQDPATAAVALPRLAAIQDTDGLVAAMTNEKLDDAVRQGAIDALGTIILPEVPDLLANFGANEDHDEMLRKAAWRARRRVTRRL